MGFATLSFENRIQARLTELGCSAGFLCTLVGIPPSRLSAALRGITPMSAADESLLLGLTDELKALATAFHPVPVALENVQHVRLLLDSVRNTGLSPEIIRKMISKLFGKQ